MKLIMLEPIKRNNLKKINNIYIKIQNITNHENN